MRAETGVGARVGRKAPVLADTSAVYRETVAKIRSLKWRHLITARTDKGDQMAPPTAGYTTWIAPMSADRIGALSWEWVVIDPGVITVENMLQVASNLYPTEETGEALGPSRRTQILVQVLSSLNWYDVVRDFALRSGMR